MACGNNMSEFGDSSLIIPGPKSKCGQELMSNVRQNLTRKLRITKSYDDRRLCVRIMNSASAAARAAGGNMSALSLRSPDIEMASSPDLSMEGVVAAEKLESRIGGGSLIMGFEEDELRPDMHRRHQSSIFLWNNRSLSRVRILL